MIVFHKAERLIWCVWGSYLWVPTSWHHQFSVLETLYKGDFRIDRLKHSCDLWKYDCGYSQYIRDGWITRETDRRPPCLSSYLLQMVVDRRSSFPDHIKNIQRLMSLIVASKLSRQNLKKFKHIACFIVQDDLWPKILYFGVFIVHSLYLTDQKYSWRFSGIFLFILSQRSILRLR